MSENKYSSKYDDNKIPNTIYVSGEKANWKGRFVSQIIEENEQSFVVSEKGNATLYMTSGGKQKIQATILETGQEKQVPVLYVSRINVKTGKIACSGEQQMCLYPEVVEKLYNFIGKTKNRSNSWKLSNDVVESVSQILEQKASGLIKLDKQQFNSDGNIITQKAYDSKVILLIGHWNQLEESKNDLEREIKKKTFELFRTDSRNIEILTYDELYDRAKYIVEGREEVKSIEIVDDLPF